MTADLPAFTVPQTRALHILRARGYIIAVVHRDEDKMQLGVAGRDPSNARVLGVIDARGKFVADLVDFAPSKVGVSAPPSEPTIEEVIG